MADINIHESEEVWKPVIGYEGFYEASNLGRIKTISRAVEYIRKCGKGTFVSTNHLRAKLRKPQLDKLGYLRIRLRNDHGMETLKVHRIIAMIFIVNPDNKPQVNHKDGNKQNNSSDNLEWMTCSENILHAYRFLGKKTPSLDGGRAVSATKDGTILSFNSLHEAQRSGNGFSASCICSAISRGGKHKGYKWEYAD